MISAGGIWAMVVVAAGLIALDRIDARFPSLRRRREW